MKFFLLFLLIIVLAYIGLLLYPNTFFSYKTEYKNYTIYSDEFIPKEIGKILDDAQKRIEKSELYYKKDRYKIFICNASWRLFLFTRSTEAGGTVNAFSSNVFIRKSDIKKNKILKEQEIYTPKERPLSYFMAHELTHVMQHKLSNIMPLTKPKYIMEGYADYIGKEPNFDYDKYLNDYKNKTFFMNIKSGMYNRYHLFIAFLMDKKGMSYQEVFDKEFSMEEVEKMMNSHIKIDKIQL